MLRPLIASTLLLAATGLHAEARIGDVRCDVHSDYDLTLNQRSLILIKQNGEPRRIVMRQGRLFVDDAWVTLSQQDSERVAEFERETRQSVPLAQDVGRQAADIALTALGEVAAGFSRDPVQTRRQLDQVRSKVDVRLRQSFSGSKFAEIDIDDEIGSLVKEMLPQLIGDVVSGAVQAALSGNEAQIRSLDGLDERIEKIVEPQARRLEPLALKLCQNMQRLDTLDNALAYRLPSGSALDLLQVELKSRDAKSE
jgi:hypothetical protein